MRKILSVIAVALFASNIFWYIYLSNHPSQEMNEFSITPTWVDYKFKDEEEFPILNPSTKEWELYGQAFAPLSDLLLDYDPAFSVDGRFIVIRLSDPGSMNDFRLSLLALADQGICQAGVISNALPDEDGMRQVQIFRINWIRTDANQRRKCKGIGTFRHW